MQRNKLEKLMPLAFLRRHNLSMQTTNHVLSHVKNVCVTESINLNTDPTYVWNRCKILKNKWININKAHSDSHLQLDKVTNEALNKISPPWVSLKPSWLPRCKKNEFFSKPFVELNTSINSRNTKSAPGMDGIDFDIIMRLSTKYRLILLDIFNKMYRTNYYPKEWKKSFVLFIKKPDGKSVRPIALTSCLCKIFDSLIKNRLEWWCESQNILPPSQSGFRKGRSCTDNLTNLTLQADHAIGRKKNYFLDVRGAFDNVNSDILLQKLANIGCSKNVAQFIKFLTHERTIHTDTLGENFRQTGKGVPQGGILSPLLYLIYVKDITDNIPKSVPMISLYIRKSRHQSDA